MRNKLLAFFLLIVFYGCATTNVTQVQVRKPKVVTDKSKIKPIAITKVVAKIKRGTHIGRVTGGTLCIPQPGGDIKWKAGSSVPLDTEDLVDIFREELELNEWPVVGSTDDLFSGYDVSGAEVLVAAKIIDMEIELCAPMSGFGNWNSHGSMRMDVEWQIYSPRTKSLIGSIYTSGSHKIESAQQDTAYELFENSFAVSVNNLLADYLFYEYVSKSEGLGTSSITDKYTSINNKLNNFNSIEESIEHAKKSTVVVRTAIGHGSGFAIGDGSMILTNAHVVGNANNVTLISYGGISINGNVLSVSKTRDVALVKIDGINLPSLHIDTKIPLSGSTVYAVGAPIDEQLASSVTSGIISGTRIFDGLNWIQSDVSINPGNSGGPLIDKNGSVIGISTAGFQYGGSQVGLNLFVPIEEALIHSLLNID